MKKIIVSALAIIASAATAHAFDAVQDVDPATAKADHPFKILGMAPGMTFEEIKAGAAEHDIGLYLKTGTYGIRSGAKSVSYETELKFDTTLYDNYYMYKNLPEYDRMNGNMSSPASGSVATSISRSFRIPMAEAPSWESVMTKLVNSYGEPSYTENEESYWILDGEGNHVEGNPEEIEGGCVIPSSNFNYTPAEDLDQNFCSAVYFAKGHANSLGLTATFRIQDINLYIADVAAMSAQMEAEIEKDAEETDLDL